MGLLRQLAEGKPGVRFACPARYESLRESEDFAMLADRERRVGLPPPRYALCLADDHLVQFTRVSYACTAGQRTLTVGSLPDLRLVPRPGRADALRGTAAQRMAAMAPNDPNGRITGGDPAGTARDTHVDAYLQYRGFDGRHTAYRWIARADGAVLFIAVNGVDCLPREALFADVETVAASLRPLDDLPARARSWWRFWRRRSRRLMAPPTLVLRDPRWSS